MSHNIRYFLRKARTRREVRQADFDSSAVADLAFLLLIFFIVTSSFILRQGLFLSLPSSKSSAVRVDAKKLFKVYPQKAGFKYKGKRYDRAQLAAELQKQKEKIKDLIMIIYMNEEVAYERLVDTMSLAKEQKIKKLSIKDT